MKYGTHGISRELLLMKPSVSKQKILVIDDEESYRQVITITLQMIGYEIIEATNGLDGLAAAKMHHPDMILCDINMPKMDGIELLNTLKNEQEFAGIPFVFLTGNAGPGDMRKGMQLGADDYLTKPFTAEELINAIEVRLAKKKTIQKYFESQFDDIKSNITLALPHEFRTPLNGILGFSQILIDEDHISEEEVKQIGRMINRSGKRLHHLLENMVLFGQLQLWLHDENKTAELRRDQAIKIGDIITSMAEHEMKKHDRPGAIHISVAETSVQISGHFLKKILEEILDNSLKFSSAASVITISCERKDQEVCLVIHDSGRGMSDEQLHKISGFQQFERGYYEQQGAGLGLAVTKLLIDIHGGDLTIESEKNKGTTVCITLPAGE